MCDKIHIVKCKEPKLKIPEMLCDSELSPKLRDYPWFHENVNSHCTMTVCGRQGSGKSSFILQLLTDRKSPLFRVFHTIYLFIPLNSRNSQKGGPWDKLPEDQIFDTLNEENLQNVISRVSKDATENYNSIILFDDVQDAFRNSPCEKLLNSIVANQRHMRLSLYFLCQNFTKLHPSIRDLSHVYVLYDAGKRVNHKIFEQLVQNLNKDDFDFLMSIVYRDTHDRLTINTRTHKLYRNFDKINIE